MFAAPPKMNKVVIHSMNCEKLIDFYFELGMLFIEKIEGEKIKHFTYTHGDFIFEIREVHNFDETTQNASFRFLIDEIDGYIDGLKKMGIKFLKDSWLTEKHQHILLTDPDGNIIELITKK